MHIHVDSTMWKMPKHGLSLIRFFPYMDKILSVFSRIWTDSLILLILPKYGKIRISFCPPGYDKNPKLFRTNSFVLAHSSAKKFYKEQLTLKSSIQWYHIAFCPYTGRIRIRESSHFGIFYALLSCAEFL